MEGFPLPSVDLLTGGEQLKAPQGPACVPPVGGEHPTPPPVSSASSLGGGRVEESRESTGLLTLCPIVAARPELPARTPCVVADAHTGVPPDPPETRLAFPLPSAG